MMSRFPMKEKTNYMSDETSEDEDFTYSLQLATLPVYVEEIIAETDRDPILSTVKGYLKTGKWNSENS